MTSRKGVLVVGAGFAGAVMARELADHGRQVLVIDRRPHLCGNAFDEHDQRTGTLFHRYGPHIFHTNSTQVVDWLSRFTTWLPYRHRVLARVEGKGLLPLPINLDTVNGFFGTHFASAEEIHRFLEEIRTVQPQIVTARDYAESRFGAELTEVFFARYTKKMWGYGLEDLPSRVLARLPFRTDRRDDYFDDTFQAMPADGYHAMFRRMLDHPGIKVKLSTPFEMRLLHEHDQTFLSMPIDEFFGYDLGHLPYRAVDFRHCHVALSELSDHTVPTINLTDPGPVTRRTRWSLYPAPHRPRPTGNPVDLVTDELPRPSRPGEDDRFYPLLLADGSSEALYRRYRDRALGIRGVSFIGRCGTYRYFDMHQVVGASLAKANRYLAGLPLEDGE